jgi:hypothetical protein
MDALESPLPRRSPHRATYGAARSAALALRLFSALQLLLGAALVAGASYLAFPPGKGALTLALTVTGLFLVAAALAGFLAASPRRAACCVAPYLALSALALLAQAAILAFLLAAPGRAEVSVARAGAARALDPAAVAVAVGAGRWALLAAVLAQLAAAGVAFGLRCCARRARGFEAFREPPGVDLEAQFRAHEAKLARLRERAAPPSAQGKPAGRAVALAAVSGGAAAAPPPPPRDRIHAGRGAAPAASPLRPPLAPPLQPPPLGGWAAHLEATP